MIRIWPDEIVTDDVLCEYFRRMQDRMYQALMMNLWDLQPGEIERWEDDGGK